MKRKLSLLLLSVVIMCTYAQMPKISLPDHGWTNIDYVGDNIEGHKLDVFLPDSIGGPYVPIVLIYGSAWFANNAKDAATFSVGKPLLDAGFAIVSINHRGSPEAKFPAQINDVKAAIRFIRANAEKYNLDTSFIGITGFSSGGHLSSLAGATNGTKEYSLEDVTIDIEGSLGNFTDQSSDVNAVVDWFGPIDMTTMENCETVKGADSPEAVLMGVAPADNMNLTRLLSPMTYIDATDPKVLVIHGNSDSVVPYCQSVNYASALSANGNLADFITVDGGEHGPVTFNEETFRTMVDFFLRESENK